MERRIDELYCDAGSAEAKIKGVVQEISNQAAIVREEVAAAIQERIVALQARQQHLLMEVEALAASKIEILHNQICAIKSGTCPPAPSEDPDEAPIEGRYLLEADSVISFRLGDGDFADKIASFGRIGDSSTYASQSFANGPGLGVLKVNNPSYVWVFSCDRVGERRKEGGDRVVAYLSHPEEFEDLQIEDLKDGRYKICFLPLNSGSFQLHVAIGPDGMEEAVAGSPFTLTVRAPTIYTEIGKEHEIEGKVKLGVFSDAQRVGVLGSMHHPSGLAFDQSGRYVFVVDQSNHRIQVFDTETHEAIHSWGKKGVGMMDLDTPCGIIVDRENRVIVSDLLNHRLQVLEFNARTKELMHLRTVGMMGSGPGQFLFPKGLGLTENGGVLVCDSGNHRVQVLDTLDRFKFVREFGQAGYGEGQFDSPLDATVSVTGEIIVSDSSNRIQVFDAKGGFLRQFGTKGRKDGCFNYPANIAVNDENALFICDQGNHRVQIFNATDGQFLHKWGGSKKKKGAPGETDEVPTDGADGDTVDDGGEKPPEWQGLRCPAGIAVNASGLIVVSDYQSNVLFAF